MSRSAVLAGCDAAAVWRVVALGVVVCVSLAGCVASGPATNGEGEVEVEVTAEPLLGSALFSDAFSTRSLSAWSATSGWTATNSLASAASYDRLPSGRSGAAVARVGTCSGTCTLQSPAIALTNASAVTLELSVTTNLSSTASDFVGLRVFDGGTWRDLGSPWPRAAGTTAWSRVAVDLGAFKGVANFRFALYGRSLESGDFAQFDDVVLSANFDAPVCGDGRRGGNEECDGSDLGGNTCTALGFNGGTLGCSATCSLNTAGCADQTQAGIDCRNPATWPAAWTQFEEQVLVLINQRRAAGATCGTTPFAAAPALASNDKLRQAARCHSLDMATQNYFSHTGLDGSNPGARIAAAGYVANAWGENIAAGYRTPQQAVDGWVASEGHCRNLMSTSFSQVGTGYAFDADAQYDHYWTQDFGNGR